MHRFRICCYNLLLRMPSVTESRPVRAEAAFGSRPNGIRANSVSLFGTMGADYPRTGTKTTEVSALGTPDVASSTPMEKNIGLKSATAIVLVWR